MKLGVLLLCRYSSSRLPGKILLPIEGKPLIWHIYQRLRKIMPAELLVICTSTDPSDDQIEAYCKEQGWQYYRGDLNDVAGRFLAAAEQFDFSFATRINGDNLFVDLQALRQMANMAVQYKYDFISNVKDRSFPYGMSVEIVKTDFYRKVYQKMDTDYYKEHVTIYLYEHEEAGNRHYFFNEAVPAAAGLKLAVDTPEDLAKAKIIMAKLKDQDYEYDLQSLTQTIQSLDA
ncbi:MAG: NTP transferase domain-containing protein [Bacteroidota bacterium]